MSNKRNQLFGQCRCCLNFGSHDEIAASFYRDGVQQVYIREVYRQTFLETFNLCLATNPSVTSMMCKSCVDRLNDAAEFKAMVMASERTLLSKAEDTASIEFVNIGQLGALEGETQDHNGLMKQGYVDLHIPLEETEHMAQEGAGCSCAVPTVGNTAVCAQGDVKLELEAEGAAEEERQCDILTQQRKRAGAGAGEGGALSARRNNSIMVATRAKRKRTNYSPECLELALKAIRDEGIGIRESCRKYKVPRTTIQDRLSGRRTDVFKKTGPTPVLGAPGETKVVEWLMHISKCGFPVKKKELLDTVQKILKDLKLPNPFKDDRPGQTWYQSFLKRHPEISARAAEGMRRARAAPTEQSIRLWFRQLETHLAQEAHSDILQHPDRIFSAGECGFSFCPKTGKVLEPKECDGDDNMTVMAAFNACGEQAPLVVVSPEAREWCPLPASDSAPPHWTIGQSDTGRMNSDTFFEYITNDLNTWLECKDTRKPVLLLVDGHSAHMSLALSAMCEEMGIILYALPPNAARLLQPADVSVFAPLTARWRKHRQILLSKPENVNKTVTETFCRLLQDIVDTAETKSNIINGFRRCGLYPFDPNAVDYTKCTTSRDCSRSF